MDLFDLVDKYLSVIISAFTFILAVAIVFSIKYWSKKTYKYAKNHYLYTKKLANDQFNLANKPNIIHIYGYFQSRYCIMIKNVGNGLCIIDSINYKFGSKEFLSVNSAVYQKMEQAGQDSDLINEENIITNSGTVIKKGEELVVFDSGEVGKIRTALFNNIFSELEIEIKFLDIFRNEYVYSKQLIYND